MATKGNRSYGNHGFKKTGRKYEIRAYAGENGVHLHQTKRGAEGWNRPLLSSRREAADDDNVLTVLLNE